MFIMKWVNKMVINYDVKKINQMLQDFYNATGINMDLLRADFSFVGNHSHWEKKRYCKAIQSTERGRKACLCSDACLLKKSQNSKKIEMHVCHGGLVDISIPVLYNDIIIGYLIFGQIKTGTDYNLIEAYLAEIGLDKKQMKKYYSELSVLSLEQIESISNIAQMLVKHILLENMLKPNFDESVGKALCYINENLQNSLTIQNISKNANISKSALYRNFHRYFDCTVSQYINKKRIEKAVEFLLEGNLTNEEIALKTGFSGGAYFSKMFKKEKGVSPLRYKKDNLFNQA